MAVRFMDSFDHYATADLLTKYTSIISTPTISASGRNGSALLLATPGSMELRKGVTGMSSATVIIGFAFKYPAAASSNGLFVLLEGATAHVTLETTVSGGFVVYRNTTGGTVISTSATGLWVANQWQYLEFKAVIADGTGGSVEIRINGATVHSASSLDTRNGGTAGLIDTFALGDNAGTSADDIYYDDLYVKDDGTFLGDIRVEALFPSGNGNSSVLVGSDANSTDNYLLVDEAAPSTADGYVESSNVGDKDTYAFGNLTPTTGTVHAVQVLPYAAKTDAGTRSIASIARLSGTEVDSANKALGTTYAYLPDIRETKPGGGAWSISDVNSAEFGVKVTV